MEQVRGGHRMTPDANLDPKVAALVSAAFDKSWPFVKTDPELAHVDRQEVRTRLAQNLARIAQGGSRTPRSVSCGANAARRSSAHSKTRWVVFPVAPRRSRRGDPRCGDPCSGAGGPACAGTTPGRSVGPHITPGASRPPDARAWWRVRTAG